LKNGGDRLHREYQDNAQMRVTIGNRECLVVAESKHMPSLILSPIAE
jgi:hypothetical protein